MKRSDFYAMLFVGVASPFVVKYSSRLGEALAARRPQPAYAAPVPTPAVVEKKGLLFFLKDFWESMSIFIYMILAFYGIIAGLIVWD